MGREDTDSSDEILIPLESMMGSSDGNISKSASFLEDEEALEDPNEWKQRWKRMKKTRWYRLTRAWGPLTLTTFIVFLVLLIGGVTLWRDLTWQGWIAVIDVAILLILLINDTFEAHFTMMLGMVIMLITTIIDVSEALKGFSSSGVATIAVLFVVAKAIQLCGALKYVLRYVLRRPKWLVVAQIRLLIPVAVLSAFTNNTPIVAMMVPLVQSWCRQTSFKTSHLLMPLSFATILGGTCTLIGTSTNLIVVSLISDEYPGISVGFFEVGYVGLPVMVVGLIYMMAFCRCLFCILVSEKR